MAAALIELSVLIPFCDGEDYIGSAVKNITAAMRGLGRTFELIAVDENSGDNSVALLSLLQASTPELTIVGPVVSGRGYQSALLIACGETVVLIDPRHSAGLEASLGELVSQIDGGHVALAVVDEKFAVGRSSIVSNGVRELNVGSGFFGRLASDCKEAGHRVMFHGHATPGAAPRRTAQRSWARLFQALPNLGRFSSDRAY